MCHLQVSFPSRVTRKVLCASSRAPYKTTPRGRALEAGWRLSRGRREAAPAPRRAGFAPRHRPSYRGGRRRPGVAPQRRARAAPPRRRPRYARPRPPPGLNRAAGPACLSAPLRGVPPTGSLSGSRGVAMWPTAAIAVKGRFLRRRGRSRCTFFSQAPSSVPSLDSYRVSPPEGPPGPR